MTKLWSFQLWPLFVSSKGAIDAILELANGTIAIAGSAGVQIVDPSSGKTIAAHGTLTRVQSVVELDDGRIVSSSSTAVSNVLDLTAPDHRSSLVGVWHPDNPTKVLATFDGHASFALVFDLDDGLILSGAVNGPRGSAQPGKSLLSPTAASPGARTRRF